MKLFYLLLLWLLLLTSLGVLVITVYSHIGKTDWYGGFAVGYTVCVIIQWLMKKVGDEKQ